MLPTVPVKHSSHPELPKSSSSILVDSNQNQSSSSVWRIVSKKGKSRLSLISIGFSLFLQNLGALDYLCPHLLLFLD